MVHHTRFAFPRLFLAIFPVIGRRHAALTSISRLGDQFFDRTAGISLTACDILWTGELPERFCNAKVIRQGPRGFYKLPGLKIRPKMLPPRSFRQVGPC